MDEIGFDDAVRMALRERAEGPVKVEDLLSRARRRGVWRRRVHRSLLGGGTASVMAVVALISATGTGSRMSLDENPDAAWLPRPPRAEQGEANVLWLDVDDPDAYRLEWASEGDRERLTVGVAPKSLGVSGYVVSRGLSEADVSGVLPETSDGEQRNVTMEELAVPEGRGTLRTDEGRWAALAWQQPDGIWLGVSMSFEPPGRREPDYRAVALEVARRVRGGPPRRCAVDFRLDWLPPGSQLWGCVLGISPESRRYGLVYRSFDSGGFLLSATTVAASATVSLEVNTSIGGREVDLKNSQTGRYGYGDRVLEVVASPAVPTDDVLRVIGGFTPMPEQIPKR